MDTFSGGERIKGGWIYCVDKNKNSLPVLTPLTDADGALGNIYVKFLRRTYQWKRLNNWESACISLHLPFPFLSKIFFIHDYNVT